MKTSSKIFLVLVLLVVKFASTSLVIYNLWNLILHQIFEVQSISGTEAFGIMVIVSFLRFKGFENNPVKTVDLISKTIAYYIVMLIIFLPLSWLTAYLLAN